MIRVKVLGTIERDHDGTFIHHTEFEDGYVYYPVTENTIVAERDLADEDHDNGTSFFQQANQLLDIFDFIQHDEECDNDPPPPDDYCFCLPKTENCVFYLEYMNDSKKVYLVDPDENNRLRAFLKRPDPFHRVAEILEHHLEVGLDLTAVQANAAEHAAENDKPKKRAKKE
jgi:hypothetical protein